MAVFDYIVKDDKGIRVEGSIKTSSMDEAIDKLTKEGNTIISVKSADEGAFKGRLSLFDRLIFGIYKIRTGVRLSVLVFFTRQLATMFSAGLTLEKSITNLAKDEKSKKFRKVLFKLTEDIKKGFSLSEAMDQHPGVFSALYVSLVKAGEVSGTLHTVLDDLAIYLENMQDTRRKVWSAMTYPIFILTFVAIVVWGLFYFVIPMFAKVYANFHADLPGPTLTAIAISNVVSANLFYTVLFLLAFAMIFVLFYLSDKGRYFIDMLLLKIPVVGTMLEYSIMSKFARTFSILMYAGIPITEALELVENVVQNAVTESAVRKARIMIKEGYTVAGAFKKTGVFPSTIIQLLATGEESGELDKLIRKAAEYYEKLLNSIINRLTSLIEPILVIIMAVLVGSIIIVTYLPVFKLGMAINAGTR
ncbi:MAG: type II secretion system F family protein [Candidatus Cloacimonadota bacterium]|nr:type II secretion system F family protein [Candidatus Cloacimonadota bacterium]